MVEEDFPEDIELQQAAWLHDTHEDCGITLEMLAWQFSPGVSRLVDEVSWKHNPIYNVYGNAKMKCLKLSKASVRGKTLKCYDIAANLSDWQTFYKVNPKKARAYLEEKHKEIDALCDQALKPALDRALHHLSLCYGWLMKEMETQ